MRKLLSLTRHSRFRIQGPSYTFEAHINVPRRRDNRANWSLLAGGLVLLAVACVLFNGQSSPLRRDNKAELLISALDGVPMPQLSGSYPPCQFPGPVPSRGTRCHFSVVLEMKAPYSVDSFTNAVQAQTIAVLSAITCASTAPICVSGGCCVPENHIVLSVEGGDSVLIVATLSGIRDIDLSNVVAGQVSEANINAKLSVLGLPSVTVTSPAIAAAFASGSSGSGSGSSSSSAPSTSSPSSPSSPPSPPPLPSNDESGRTMRDRTAR